MDRGPKDRIGITFTQHVADQQKHFPGATGSFTALLQEIMVAAKIISREVRKAGLVDALGLTGHTNVQGEAVQILDEFANETIIRNVHHTGHLCVMSSEENADPILIPEEYPKGPYAMTFDPLDGSSNIDANVSIGTIFSIHRRVTASGDGGMKDLLQPGRSQVAAGYVIYGSSTILVYSTGHEVHGFTLDPTVGEFLCSHPNIRIPDSGAIYSVNEGNAAGWDARDAAHRGRSQERAEPGGEDVQHALHRIAGGGLPPHARLRRDLPLPARQEEPAGKAPASRARPRRSASSRRPRAGAPRPAAKRSSTSCPTELHQRVPLIVGSRREVEWVESCYREGARAS